MLLTRSSPQVFREYHVGPGEAEDVAAKAVGAARALRSDGVGCAAFAVHLSLDRRRVVTVEAWTDERSYREHGRGGTSRPYARWQSAGDFPAAFSATQGTAVSSTDEINQAAARMTRGLLRTDYHTYELIDADEGN